jgi:DNA polymerase V
MSDDQNHANARFGSGTLGLAFSAWRTRKGMQEMPRWRMNEASLSKHYTTSWKEIAVTK